MENTTSSVEQPPQRHVEVRAKTYVLDTNVLLHDPQSIFKFEDNNLAIPVEVLEELAQGEDDPWRTLSQEVQSALFPRHPYRRALELQFRILARVLTGEMPSTQAAFKAAFKRAPR